MLHGLCRLHLDLAVHTKIADSLILNVEAKKYLKLQLCSQDLRQFKLLVDFNRNDNHLSQIDESNLVERGIIKNSAIEDKRRASKATQMSTTKENETKKLFSIWKTTTQHL